LLRENGKMGEAGKFTTTATRTQQPHHEQQPKQQGQHQKAELSAGKFNYGNGRASRNSRGNRE